MTKILVLAPALALFLVQVAHADSPSWTYLEASYVAAEVDALEEVSDEIGADISEPDGFEIGGAFAVADFVYLDFQYSDLSDDGRVDVAVFDGFGVQIVGVNVDLEVERIEAGVGMSWSVADSTDLYGHLGYEDWTITFEASARAGDIRVSAKDEIDDNGVTAAIGVRSVVVQNLEIQGEIGYSDVFEEATFLAGIYYTFADHFTIGAGYEKIDEFESLRGTLRYQF